MDDADDEHGYPYDYDPTPLTPEERKKWEASGFGVLGKPHRDGPPATITIGKPRKTGGQWWAQGPSPKDLGEPAVIRHSVKAAAAAAKTKAAEGKATKATTTDRADER